MQFFKDLVSLQLNTVPVPMVSTTETQAQASSAPTQAVAHPYPTVTHNDNPPTPTLKFKDEDWHDYDTSIDDDLPPRTIPRQNYECSIPAKAQPYINFTPHLFNSTRSLFEAPYQISSRIIITDSGQVQYERSILGKSPNMHGGFHFKGNVPLPSRTRTTTQVQVDTTRFPDPHGRYANSSFSQGSHSATLPSRVPSASMSVPKTERHIPSSLLTIKGKANSDREFPSIFHHRISDPETQQVNPSHTRSTSELSDSDGDYIIPSLHSSRLTPSLTLDEEPADMSAEETGVDTSAAPLLKRPLSTASSVSNDSYEDIVSVRISTSRTEANLSSHPSPPAPTQRRPIPAPRPPITPRKRKTVDGGIGQTGRKEGPCREVGRGGGGERGRGGEGGEGKETAQINSPPILRPGNLPLSNDHLKTSDQTTSLYSNGSSSQTTGSDRSQPHAIGVSNNVSSGRPAPPNVPLRGNDQAGLLDRDPWEPTHTPTKPTPLCPRKIPPKPKPRSRTNPNSVRIVVNVDHKRKQTRCQVGRQWSTSTSSADGESEML